MSPFKPPGGWVSAWSVGRVLNKGLPAGYPIPESALRRGIAVHAWTAAYDTGQECGSDQPASQGDLSGYCEAWRRFNYLSPSWNKIEYVFDTGAGGYHGVVDRAGDLRGATVCEIKTGEGPSQHRTALQLAAYTQALFPATYRTVQRLEVRLSRKGTYKAVTHADVNDFLEWNELLRSAVTGDNNGNQRHPPERYRDTPHDASRERGAAHD
jgi:hypothetical protein